MKKLLSILSNLSLFFFAFLFFFAPSRALALSQLSIVPGTNSATIYWYTPNAETSLINYGTSPKGLYLSAANLTPVRFHSLTLLNLSPGTTYFFHIFEQKNDNQERYSSFTTTGAAKVTGSQNQQATSLGRTLKQGMSGSDVRTLQTLLNKDSRTRVAATGPGSPGNETMLFGPATTAAVVRFQELYRSQILTPNGLSKGTGVVASATLKQFAVLFGSGAVAITPSASTPNTPYQPTYGVGGNPTTPYTPPVYPAYNPQPNPGSPTYTITASADPGGSISPAGTVSVAYGSSISFTILAKSGYQPSALIIDGVSLSATGVYTFPSVAANHSIRAVFSTAAITPAPNPGPSPSPTPSPTPAPVAYVITASAGAGGSISPAGSVSVTSGTSKTFTLTPSSGYKIATLLIDGVSLSPAGSYTFSNVTASHTISATFALIAATPPAAPTSYTITASAGAGGSISPSGAISVASGASKTFILTPNQGYQLGSLLVDGVAPGSGAALSGFVAPASLGAPTSYTFSNVTANHTISATFTQIVSQTYVISASAGAGGTITPSGSVSVVSGGSQTFTITPNSGYQVLNVLADGISDMPSHPTGVPITYAIPYTFNSVVANHTLAVTFTPVVVVPVNYTITSTAGANGSISPSGAVSVASGAAKTFTITPNSGYKIGLLVIDGVSVPAVSSYTFSNVLANHTISATFDLIPPTTYTITASAGTGGSISPSGIVSVTSGSSATFTATPSSGYQFGSLYIDGVLVSGGSSYTFSNVTANHTISVTFNVIVVTPPATPPSAKFVIGDRVQVSSGPLNVRAAAGGTLLGTQATGALGTIGSGPTATTGGNTTVITTWWGINFDTGVDGWSADDYLVKYVAPTPPPTPPVQPPASPTPPPAVSYTITASAGANGTISPVGAVTVASGASQSFTITPNSGYKIHTLVVDGVGVFAGSPYVFTNVTANHTISAAFVAVPAGSYTITSNSGPNGYVSPQGSLTVPSGTNQAISIVANSGYKIADVLIDGVSIVGSGQAPTSYTFSNVTANHSLYATFAYTGITPPPPPPPPSGITAQFDFDGSLTNSAGSDVAVMRGGAPVFTQINAQTSQKALVLDGIDDYVSIPSSAALNVGTGNFTASAWINPAKLKDGIHWRVLDKIGTTGFTIDVVDMGGYQQPHIHFGAIDNNAVKVDFYVAADFLVNEWAMLTIVVNRSSRTVQFYQNATLLATENIPTLTGSLDNSEPFGIGLIPSLEGSAAYHKGLVAKVRLNKSALTAAEIKTRFTAEDPIFQSFTDIVHTGSSPYNDFMRANARTVFGFKNLWYANGDRDHANFRVDQISSDFGKSYSGYGIGVHAAVTGKATIGNSSTAGGGLAGSNVGQLCLGTGYNGYEYVYGQAVRPNVPFQGVYPAVRDGGETNNTVYLPCVSKVAIPTTGHSSGEIKTGTTFARVAGAFKFDVGQYLLQRGTIWSAVAAINEWSRNGKSSAALLGRNSTTYVLGSDETESRLMDMAQIANGMTVATTPPEARFTVTKSPSEPLIKGVNTYDDNTEVMFKTPQSAAFTARNLFTKTRVYEVDASASVAPPGATIAEYNWVVTWGDSSKVRITYLNQSHSQARIEIDWHGAEEVPSRYGAGIKSNMYIISLFVKSSTGVYSDSAVLTEYSMPNERRVYDASGKLTEVYFDWNVEGPGTGSGYSETSKFMVRKDFKNLYKYDAGGNLIGWTTKYLDDRFVGDFDARGYKVTYKPDGVTIDTYQVPTYTVDSSGYLQTTYGPTQTAYSGPVGNFINQLASALFSLFGW